MTIINIKLKYCKNSILKFYKYAILKAVMKKSPVCFIFHKRLFGWIKCYVYEISQQIYLTRQWDT